LPRLFSIGPLYILVKRHYFADFEIVTFTLDETMLLQ